MNEQNVGDQHAHEVRNEESESENLMFFKKVPQPLKSRRDKSLNLLRQTLSFRPHLLSSVISAAAIISLSGCSSQSPQLDSFSWLWKKSYNALKNGIFELQADNPTNHRARKLKATNDHNEWPMRCQFPVTVSNTNSPQSQKTSTQLSWNSVLPHSKVTKKLKPYSIGVSSGETSQMKLNFPLECEHFTHSQFQAKLAQKIKIDATFSSGRESAFIQVSYKNNLKNTPISCDVSYQTESKNFLGKIETAQGKLTLNDIQNDKVAKSAVGIPWGTRLHDIKLQFPVRCHYQEEIKSLPTLAQLGNSN